LTELDQQVDVAVRPGSALRASQTAKAGECDCVANLRKRNIVNWQLCRHSDFGGDRADGALLYPEPQIPE
jgi:hypothetical protein